MSNTDWAVDSEWCGVCVDCGIDFLGPREAIFCKPCHDINNPIAEPKKQTINELLSEIRFTLDKLEAACYNSVED